MSNDNKKPGTENSPMVGHEYDGIQEFDNPAPFWWQLFFYISIAFAAVYYFYYEFGGGSTSDQRLNEQLAAIELVQSQNKPKGPNEDELLAMSKDSGAISAGKAAYATKCASCHAADGGGLIGPNLADNFWIHGKGSPGDTHKVIADGVLEKGMPAWNALMSPTELNQVTAYVLSLKGTKPAAPKAPQGTEVK